MIALNQEFKEKLEVIFDSVFELPKLTDDVQEKISLIVSGDISKTITALTNYLEEKSMEIKGYKSNGIYKTFQLDGYNLCLIFATKNNFDWLCKFYSYSINTVLIEAFRGTVFKVCEEGVIYEKRSDNPQHQSKTGSFLISQDFEKVLIVSGFNHVRFEGGFNTLEQLFEFFESSSAIDLKRLSTYQKVREGSLLSKFIKHLNEKEELPEYNSEVKKVIELAFMDKDVEAKIKELEIADQRKRALVEKFSGKTVLEDNPKFDKKIMGRALKEFKHSFGSAIAYEDFILKSPVEQILKAFKQSIEEIV